MEYQFKGINTALQTLCREILDKGVWRETRGFKCLEFSEPVLIKITDPTSRWCTIKERKWNYILPYAESLWLALGYNNLNDLPGYYVKSIYNYSDDGVHWRGAYSPRLRFFSASKEQYYIGKSSNIKSDYIDQYKFIERSFKKDSNTRQAVITISDPNKDCEDLEGNLISTLDMPCNRSYQLIKTTDNKLNFTAYLRSNDLLFGATHVNIFNHTFMQEYWSSILNIPVGQYYHFANNLHIYEDKLEMVKHIAESQDYKDESYEYKKNFKSLEEFDNLCKILEKAEEDYRIGNFYIPEEFDDFFADWAKVFIYKNCKMLGKDFNMTFVNPILISILENK